MTPNIVTDDLLQVPPEASICYFLGAGFSKSTQYCIPTAQGFLQRTMEYVDGDGEHCTINHERERRDFSGMFDRIESRFGPLDETNLEEVLNSLYVRGHGVGASWAPRLAMSQSSQTVDEIRSDYRAVVGFIDHLIRLLSSSVPFCCTTKRLVEQLRRQDSIVTLNYDPIIENHLQMKDGNDPRLQLLSDTICGATATFGGTPDPMIDRRALHRRGVLAKLHGSIEWLACSNAHCPHYLSIRGRPLGQIDLQTAMCRVCGDQAEVVILPPVASKAFERFPRLRLMWVQAYQALRAARRWVIIGVSFAPADFHLRELLRSASAGLPEPRLQQICVVDRNANEATEVAKNLFKFLAPDMRKRFASETGGTQTIAVIDSVQSFLDKLIETDVNRVDRPDDSIPGVVL